MKKISIVVLITVQGILTMGIDNNNSIDREGGTGPIPEGFIHVKNGTFWMGAQSENTNGENYNANAESDESPVHPVTLSSFYISRYEVTQAQYEAVMETNPSYFRGINNPVDMVSWYDAVKYCNILSQKMGLSPAYTINGNEVSWNRNANGYRLPTEAEWKYATLGGNRSHGFVYSGSNTVGDLAWYSGSNSSKTHNVGT